MKPIWWLEDYERIRDDCSSVELPTWSRIELNGTDRARLLNSLGTNRLDDLTVGEGRETFLTDAKGRVVAHGLVFAEEETTSFVTAASRTETIVHHLQRYVIREDVQVSDRSAQTAIWYLGGRRCEEVLQDLGLPVPREQGEHVTATAANSPVKVCRVAMAGPVGFLLITSREHARAVAAAFQQAGIRTSVRQAFEAARIQWGWPLDRVDISSENFPQEVGRDEQAISFTKGCYLGQETVARIDSLGHVNKRLSLVRFPSGKLAASASLSVEGKPVGATTSMGYSPEFSCPVALAYIRHECCVPGTQLESSIGKAGIVPFRRLAGVS